MLQISEVQGFLKFGSLQSNFAVIDPCRQSDDFLCPCVIQTHLQWVWMFRSCRKFGNISVTGISNLFQEFYQLLHQRRIKKTTCYFKHCSTMSNFLLFKRLLLVRYFVSHPCHFDQICFPSPEKNQSIGIDLRKEIWKLKLIIDCVIQ